MMDTVGSYFFSFGSPEPELTFGRLCRHHHPDNTNRKVLSAAESANGDCQPEPGCQPAAGEVFFSLFRPSPNLGC